MMRGGRGGLSGSAGKSACPAASWQAGGHSRKRGCWQGSAPGARAGAGGCFAASPAILPAGKLA